MARLRSYATTLLGILGGTFAISLGLGISACFLQSSFGWNAAVISLMASSGAAVVLGGGISFALFMRTEDLEAKDREAFKRFRKLFSNGENL